MTQPNILILMVDQLNGTLFPEGPADWLHAPNLKRLAARSTRFRNAYTASPLCAPGRASFMSGQLPSATGVYDNAAEFPSSIPTYAHHLRRAGYYTALSGKMHFVGPDQLHGFEARLTTDIYPADFGWTPDYRKPGERIDWWYHNMGSVTGALKLVPGLQVEAIESSCCGMAGAFGYQAEAYEMSKAMGELSLLPAVRAAESGTLIVADGTSCRHQISDGAARDAMHVARVLEISPGSVTSLTSGTALPIASIVARSRSTLVG